MQEATEEEEVEAEVVCECVSWCLCFETQTTSDAEPMARYLNEPAGGAPASVGGRGCER